MNIRKIREDFSILQKDSKNPLIYFDNACMTLRPRQVIESINEYYEEYPVCALRSHHKLSRLATEKVDVARKEVQKFISAKKRNEVIFTKNTTEGINLIANTLNLKGGTILTHDKEHNSNHVKWVDMVNKGIIKHKIVDTNEDGTFNLENFENKIDKDVKLVSMGHISNLDGVEIPLKEIIKITHDNGAKILVDAAQSVPHKEINVKKLGVDFLAFSGHKMLGPTGTGVLYVNEKNYEEMEGFVLGGETVKDAKYGSFEYEEPPMKYEAGLQDYSGQIGLAAASRYLSRIGMKSIAKQEEKINKIITEGLIDSVELIGPKDHKLRSGIFNFNIKNMDPHIIAGMLDSSRNIAVRSGAHCVHSWFNKLHLQGSVRASTYFYNTEEEAEIFSNEVKKLIELNK
ncbi:selenocysteine lyase [Candidatus Woesearchaeota archaeon]|nr:MAG: selenocysteine lyase [Candidatus Woesearchaeota archaeon]